MNGTMSCFCWASFVIPKKNVSQVDRLSLRDLIFSVFHRLCYWSLSLMAFSQTFGGLTIFLRIFEGRFLDFKDLVVWW